MKLFMIVNEDRFFLSHRVDIALNAQQMGYDVKIIAKDTGQFQEVKDLGFEIEDLPIEPTGMNPLHEMKTLSYLNRVFKHDKPDIVHLVGMKNILWGSMAARAAKVPGVVEAISGLGGLFSGEKMSMVTRGILAVIRWGNSRSGVKAIFQNNDDLSIFLNKNAVSPDQVCFIKGSGIDLNDFCYTPEPDKGPIKVMFTARMVKEKGVTDLIEAAERLKPRYQGKVQFLLCGRLAANTTAITEEYMREHCDGEYICWLGLRSDVKDLLKQSHIMAFPSYYREGLPKSLIEASAIGRPMITCDSVGCKDVVDDGVNGFLIAPQDVDALTDRLKRLINDPALRQDMGKKAREKAEREFSIENVVQKHMEIYASLTKA